MKYISSYLYSLILLSFSCTCLKAQTNLDSLYGVWQDKTQTDSIRSYAYIKYIEGGYVSKKPDSAYILAESLIAFGQETQFLKAKARGYYIQGNSFYYRDNYAQALEYLQLGLKTSEEAGYKNGEAYTLNRIGRIYQLQGNSFEALDYYQRSLEIREEIKNKEGISISLNNIGRIYSDQGNFKQALEYYQQSLKIREEIGNKRGIANSLHNIGSIYYDQRNYPQALDYYQRSLKIKEEIGNKNGMANSLHNMGSVAHYQANYPLALDYYQQSLKIREEIGGKNGMAYSLNNMGSIYHKQGNYPQALDFYQRSLKIRKEIGNKRAIANSLQNLGQIYYDQGRHINAIAECQNSLTIGEELGALVVQKDACSCLFKVYKNLGKSAKALVYHEQLTVLNDSLFNKANTKKITELEMQFEFDKKELLMELDHEKEVLELETENAAISRQRNYIFGGGSLLALLTFLGFRINKIRKERNDKVEFAEALLYTQEEERKRIASDLHDSIGQSLLLLKKELTSGSAVSHQNQALISNTLEEVRTISHDLHPFQLEKFGLTTTLNDTLEKIDKTTDIFVTKDVANIDGLLSDKAEIHIYRVVQESLSNIIKHAQATAANLTIQNNDSDVQIIIKDNGIGYDHEYALATSKSLGLKTMYERISSIGGKLTVKQSDPSGTIIEMNIPKAL